MKKHRDLMPRVACAQGKTSLAPCDPQHASGHTQSPLRKTSSQGRFGSNAEPALPTGYSREAALLPAASPPSRSSLKSPTSTPRQNNASIKLCPRTWSPPAPCHNPSPRRRGTWWVTEPRGRGARLTTAPRRRRKPAAPAGWDSCRG